MQDIYTNTPQDDFAFVVGELAALLFQDNTIIKSKTMGCIVAIAESSNIE